VTPADRALVEARLEAMRQLNTRMEAVLADALALAAAGMDPLEAAAQVIDRQDSRMVRDVAVLIVAAALDLTLKEGRPKEAGLN
jgi:type II secretory pathway component PulM